MVNLEGYIESGAGSLPSLEIKVIIQEVG